MSPAIIHQAEFQRLRECFRIVEMIEELCGMPFMSITIHSDDDSMPGHEHLIVIEGVLEPCRGEDLEPYNAEYFGRSLAECLEQAVAAKKAREE